MRACVAPVLAALGAALLGAGGPASALPPSPAVDSLLAGALSVAGLRPADLSFRIDYEDPDPFRLRLVDALLVNPQHTAATVDSLAGVLAAAPRCAGLVAAAAGALPGGAEAVRGEKAAVARPPGDDLAAAFVELAAFVGGEDGATWGAAFAALDGVERSRLATDGPDLLRLDEEEASLDIDEIAAAEAASDSVIVRVLAAAGRIDLQELLAAAMAAAAAADRAVAVTRLPRGEVAAAGRASPVPPWVGEPPATGDVLAVFRLADGRPAVLGGSGPTRYAVPCGLIVDLGGDDLYAAGAGGNGGQPGLLALAVDVSGNDTYEGPAPYTLAAGLLGYGILVDLGGDDLYRAGDGACGAGFAGLGLLIDQGGEDRYLCGSMSAGAGAFGLGLLRDAGGRDLYQGSTYTLGFGFVGGLGLLADQAGEDVYLCQPRFSDLLRDPTTTLSMAQGFGYGLRPRGSGGIGLLVDGGGHDRYLAEVFAQGSAYWCALGGLVDRGGNDHYDGFNYTQGAGVHVAVAALVDDAGDDLYRTKGVSQGCGHDLGLGALVDAAGNDRYDASDLGQGAGNANGAGLLLDLAGDDSYTARNPATTQGYGNLRRHQGSVGLLVDAGGEDLYLGAAARDERLWQNGEHGIGVDAARATIAALADLAAPPWPGLAAPPALSPPVRVAPPEREPYEPRPAVAPLAAVPDSFRTLSFARLFARAAAGAPRFATERDWARAEVVRRGRASSRELATRLGTREAVERHAIKDLALLLGPRLVEKDFAAVLAGPDERAARGAAWCLERVEATGVERDLVRAAKHPSWRVRAGSVLALGRGGGGRSLSVLTAGLADPDRSVRQAAALALGERFEAARRDSLATPSPELVAAPARLIAALADSSAGVRLAAARSLGRAGPIATAELARALAESGDSYRAGLLIDALGAGGDPRAVPVLAATPRSTVNPVVASHVDVALARLAGEVELRTVVEARREGVRATAATILEEDSRTRAAAYRAAPGGAPPSP